MNVLKYLLEKEFRQIVRDRFLMRIIFVLPVVQLLILPFAADFGMRNISLGIVDHDRSPLSQRLTEKIRSSGYFRLTDISGSYAETLRSVEDNEADVILEIPPRFGKETESGGQAQLLIAVNAVNGTKGGIGSSYLSSIVQDFCREHAAQEIPETDGAGREVRVLNLYNPHLDYKCNMVPAILAFLMTLIGGFLSALNIVGEKERGTIEQINVTPVPKALFLLAKLMPFWVIGLLLLTIGTCIAWIVYGLSPAGSLWIIYLFAAVYLIAFTGFGLAISSISSTQQQAMFTAFFFIIIFILMSGLFTPVSSMPEWAQQLTRLNPLRYFVEVMRMVYLKGSTLADLSGHFSAICLFAVFFNLLAIISYRKNG